MSSTVEKIKERLGIAEVVGSYIKLDKAGSNFKGKCPFHNEKTPSFFISPDRGTYYCFGCGAKGDIFSFVQEFERVDFIGALKTLAERAGVEIERSDPREKNEKERLYAAMEAATLFFSSELQKSPESMQYLKSRGLKDETIKEWRIGDARDEWNLLENHLKSKGFTQAEMEKAGLIKKGEKSFYDRFRGRIMFPLFDSSGRVIAFSGRIHKDKEGEAKYLNSPETELFNKSLVLYGYNKAKNHIRVKGYSILVEGQMDLLISQQAGYENTVATSGTALTASHLEILKRSSNKVMVVYDSDNAGINASVRAWQTALGLGMEVKIAQLPPGDDPADLIIKDEEKWRECLKNSSHIIDFYLNALVRKGLDQRRLGIEVGEKVLPYVKALESAIEQSHYLSKISAETGIKEEALRDELKKMTLEVAEAAPLPKADSAAQLEKLTVSERKILGIMFWQEKVEKPLVGSSVIKEKLATVLGKAEMEELVRRAEALRNELVFEAEVAYDQHGSLEKELDESLLNYEEDYLKGMLEKTMGRLGKAERDKNVAEVGKILEECQAISKRLAALSPRDAQK